MPYLLIEQLRLILDLAYRFGGHDCRFFKVALTVYPADAALLCITVA